MTEPEPGRGLRLRWSALGAVWLAVGTLSAVVLRWWQTRGEELPPASPWLAAMLALLGVVVLALGLRVRRWVRRREPVDGPGATRTLVLGQSVAVVGAAVAGYATALAGLALSRLVTPEHQAVALTAALTVLAAAFASGSGMVAQWCCRVPPSDEGSDEPPLGRA